MGIEQLQSEVESLKKSMKVLEGAMVTTDIKNSKILKTQEVHEKAFLDIREQLNNVETILSEMGNSKTQSSSEAGIGATISKEEATDIIKEILLEDEDLLDTFSKVVKNVTQYNQNKKDIDKYLNTVKKGKWKGKILVASIVIFCSIVVGAYYLTGGDSVTNISIPANTELLNSKNANFVFPQEYSTKAVLDDNGYYQFKIKNEIFKVKKDSVKVSN